ncbi:protein ENHANCED DISEASE RESISTANCE 4 [Dendrobium catenatum]|uniref:Uncharacterized protein n=1 Tax=Dendrobium catenatum TaxID=906689 RepID=A0A2I0WQZ8_9ASPA|nr:protein ENHANCED DISEASE RESISTANCE 4 [Dendrobium catenatum]XP_020689403.1 protein ENHANCED DISEASE RESISTANCE 4 [Dendrobium catenatum]PKU78088.1 Uncharacterized protein MA16_Dca013154 [Dendrobium catenatum]
MAGTVSIFRIVRCPKCSKLLTEFADIPVYKCGACSAVLHAKGSGVTRKSATSRSGSKSSNTPLHSSEQPVLPSSNLCSLPSSNNESIFYEKALSITHADRDETSSFHLKWKQNESPDKNMKFLHKDEENGNQLRPAQFSFDNSKSQDQLKSSSTALNFTSTLGNVSTDLKSQTNRRSYAYEASISSIDDASVDHILNKNHLMSMRTFRLQRFSKLVSNISKEGEEDNVQGEHEFNRTPLKSRTNSNESADEDNACPIRKLQFLRNHHPTYKQRASVESLPFSSRVEFETNQTSHFRGPTFISNASRTRKQDRIELSSNMYDLRNLNIGHHQCSSHPSPSSCCRSSKCSCACNIHQCFLIEEVEKLKMKDKKYQTRRQCLPISNGAPFVICSQCFELLRLPMDFFISKKGSNKLQCGSCSKILVLQFPAKDCSISNNFAASKSCPQVLQSSHSAGNESLKPENSLRVRNCEQELLPPLHQLMGYFSATEVLYQVTDVDEGYESSEPAMPDSYRRYEEERHKNLPLRYSEDEAYFDSVKVEEGDYSPKILNKRKQSHPRSMKSGVKRT